MSLPLVTEIQGQFKGFAEFNEKNGMLSSNISIITCKIIYEYQIKNVMHASKDGAMMKCQYRTKQNIYV